MSYSQNENAKDISILKNFGMETIEMMKYRKVFNRWELVGHSAYSFLSAQSVVILTGSLASSVHGCSGKNTESGLPFSFLEDLPNPETEPASPVSSALADSSYHW